MTGAIGLVMVIVVGCGPKKPEYPETDKKPVTDTYHGVTVQDDYRWLDDYSDPAVRQWTEHQNAFTRSHLDNVASRPLLAERLRRYLGEKMITYYSLVNQGHLFALMNQPPKEQPFLIVFDSPNDPSGGRIVVDPNTIDTSGSTAIDFYIPSRDGKLVAVSLSRGGSEDGTAHVFETATGKELGDVVPRVNYPTAAGSIAWDKYGTGFYYTRYPQGEERPAADRNFYQQVYYHKLGTPSSNDTYVIGKEFPRIAEIQLSTSPDGRYLMAAVANGDGGEYAHFLRIPTGKWTQVTQFADAVSSVVFGYDSNLYLISHKNAPRRKILSVPLGHPSLASANVVVPESESVIESVTPTPHFLYVVDMMGGPSEVRFYTTKGAMQNLLPAPPLATITEIVQLRGDEILYGVETYLEPQAFFRYEPATNSSTRTHIANQSTVSYADCEVVRVSATSKDGTSVPLNIIRVKGTPLDGNNPLILYGYGGYGISEVPSFRAWRRLWLDNGGIYVDAVLRGGGEFGEQWHQAGMLTKKQNVFDDFIATAQYLIDKKYTNPSRLAILGGSNGGLLMGAALTQRPDLFRAVVSWVGIYDMLRVELFPNGQFNTTEFGSVKDPEQFKALYAYSPYHHVVDATRYPAVLMLTGDNDGRVDPANSRKMIARLQAASSSPYPIMLRTSSGSGHGIGTGLDVRLAQELDEFTFLFDQLQVQVKPTEIAGTQRKNE
jgi:prolyl oligopeptidase